MIIIYDTFVMELSNTPLRELLEAHRQYWSDAEYKHKIPDLTNGIVILYRHIDVVRKIKQEDHQEEAIVTIEDTHPGIQFIIRLNQEKRITISPKH